MVPFKDYGSLTNQQKGFNYHISSGRVAIERAFGQLKGRFRRLLNKFEAADFTLLCHSIVCAAAMHNLCIENGDEALDEVVDEDANRAICGPYNNDVTGLDRRNRLFQLF